MPQREFEQSTWRSQHLEPIVDLELTVAHGEARECIWIAEPRDRTGNCDHRLKGEGLELGVEEEGLGPTPRLGAVDKEEEI